MAEKISIAFSGGGALGFGHIALVQAMEDLGLKPYELSGTSMGAIIAVSWAYGMDSQQMISYFENLVDHRSRLLGKVLKLKTRQSKSFFTGGSVFQFNALDMLNIFTPKDFPENFHQLKIPTTIVATDFYSWQERRFSSGKIMPAMAGSIAIPGIFEAVEFEDQYLIDGGCTNPMPVDALSKESDITIGVDVLSGPKGELLRPDIKDALTGGARILMQSIIKEKMKAYRPHIFLDPNLRKYGTLEFHKFGDILADSQKMREKAKRLIESHLLAGQIQI